VTFTARTGSAGSTGGSDRPGGSERPGGPDRADRPVLAVVGATGTVGAVLLGLVSERADVWGEIRLLASPRSAGRSLTVRGEELRVAGLSEEAFAGVDVAVFAVPEAVTEDWVPVAVGSGAVAVDSSRVFRMREDVPLVVPELNAGAARIRPRGIIASPGCTALAMLVSVGALHSEWGLRELIVSSYEAVSGVGRAGIDALRGQLLAVTEAGENGMELGTHPGDVRRVVADAGGEPFGSGSGSGSRSRSGSGGDGRGRHGGVRGGRFGGEKVAEEVPAELSSAPVALNVVPFTGELCAGGWTSEELTVRDETRKVLGLPQLRVAATCVRVPVITGHSVSVHARFEHEVSVEAAHEILANAPGVVLCDAPEQGEFPTPADVVGTDPAWAGRVRQSLDDPTALELFVSADNLRKGAALNALQIAEGIVAEGAGADNG
jgi:aspartate-semialdehyde dehydrogenase